MADPSLSNELQNRLPAVVWQARPTGDFHDIDFPQPTAQNYWTYVTFFKKTGHKSYAAP
jgi:hypothetical protein